MALKIDPSSLSPSGWWKADTLSGVDGSVVATWTDSSGNGRSLTQAGADSLKPTLRLFQDANNPSSLAGTHKALRFDGTDDFLQSGVNLSTFLGASGVGTIIALVRFNKTAGGGVAEYGICGVNAAAGTKLSARYDLDPRVFEAQNNDGTPDVARIKAPGPSATDQAIGLHSGAISPQTRLLVWRHDTALGTIQLGVDNLDDAAFASTATGATTDLANAFLVGRTFGHYWIGDIYELIVFPTALAEANLRGVNLYLSEKYGLPYESGIASEANPVVTMHVEMKLPSTELAYPPTLWLKADAITGLADGAAVATWTDSSGNGRNATQGTAGNRPLYKVNQINGLPAVLFDGIDDFLASNATLADVLGATGAGTFYVVARANSTGGLQTQTIMSNPGAATVYLAAVETGTDALRASNDDGTPDTADKTVPLFNAWFLGLWKLGPDERFTALPNELDVGVDNFEAVHLGYVSSGSMTAALLGQTLQFGGGIGFLNGYIAELMFFPLSHTATERRHVWSYLAAKYGLTYAFEEYQPMWVDVTEDVRSADGLKFRHGLPGSDVADRVASGGTLELSLENSTENSAGVLGYYSPEHASCRTGFRVGTPIRVSFEYLGTRYYKWHGYITNLRTAPGTEMEREVSVRAMDWMDYAARVSLSGVPIQANKTADLLMAELWVLVPRLPESAYFNKGQDTYAYGLDYTEDEGVLVLDEMHRIALSDLGYVYLRGDTVGGGQLRFENRSFRTGSPVRWALSDPELEVRGLELSDHSLDGMINLVLVELHPRKVDAGTTTVLFTLNDKPLVGATPLTFDCPYRDPTGGSFVRVGGMNMTTPAATTDYTMHANADGTGTNLTANYSVSATFGGNSAQVTVTKNSGADGYVTKLQLRGRGVYAFQSVVIRAQDSTSLAKYGHMTQRLDMPYQSSVTLANSITAMLLANNKEPRTKVQRVRFTGQVSSATMLHALAREIGDRITVSETVSGLTAKAYFIRAIEFEVLNGGIIKASWSLCPADQELY